MVIDRETGEVMRDEHALVERPEGDWLPTPQMAQALAARVAAARENAETPRELKNVRDGALLYEELWRKRGGELADGNVIVAQRLWTEVELGRMLARKTRPGNPNREARVQWSPGITVDSSIVRLSDMGITKHLSSFTQRLAAVSDRLGEWIEKRVEDEAELSTAAALAALSPSSLHVADDSYEWFTPADYIEAARRVMGSIDLDPASCEEANKVIQARLFYDVQADGLSQPWKGNVWLNPPYNMPWIERFVGRALEEYESGNVPQAIVLTNNSSDTEWFHRLLAVGPVCLTRGRIPFWAADGSKLATRQGQALFYLGGNDADFNKEFSRFGAVMVRCAD